MDLMSDETAPDPGTTPTGAARADDPTERSRWRPVFRLLSDMDDEIAQVYAENGIADLKPSWVLEVRRFPGRGPMTLGGLGPFGGQTASAPDQEVRGMRAAGWLATSP